MERLYGITPSVFALGGATTHSFKDVTDQRFYSECLGKALAADPQQLYILALGINDTTYVTKGTIEDITDDYTQNPDTFYGNYGSIIEQLMNHAPGAKFIIVKSFLPVSEYGRTTTTYRYTDDACEEIANHYGFPCIDPMDSEFFCCAEWVSGKRGGHPTAPLYAGMAKALGELLGKCILENYDYFADFMLR